MWYAKITSLLVLTFLSLFVTNQTHEFKITFTGITSESGTVRLKIVDENNKDIKKAVLTVKDLSAEFIINLPAGKYAIAAFHDENNNEKLDKSFLGLPTEKYGFSNNARGTFGPPDLTDQLINLKSNSAIIIELK